MSVSEKFNNKPHNNRACSNSMWKSEYHQRKLFTVWPNTSLDPIIFPLRSQWVSLINGVTGFASV